MRLPTHVHMTAGNGGVVVRALVKDEDGDLVMTTSVFTSAELACAYAQRVLQALEGPIDGSDLDLNDFGGRPARKP